MATSTPPPSNSSPSPSSNGVSWRLRWAQRLSWLISALSGTLEIEAETERLQKETAWLKQENVKLDAIILQTRNETERLKNEKKQIENETEQIKKEAEQIENETEQIKKEAEQIKKENERLAVLESKIEALFCKHGINLPQTQIPEQP